MQLRTVQSQQKYGLVKKTGVSKPVKLNRPSCFGNDDGDDDELGYDDNRVGVNKMLRKDPTAVDTSTLKQYQSAIAEDETIFDYDEAYDKFKKEAVSSHPLSSATSAPVRDVV